MRAATIGFLSMLIAGSAVAQTAPSGPFQIIGTTDTIFLINNVTGETWRWVWGPSQTRECSEHPAGRIPAECRIWFWQPTVFGNSIGPGMTRRPQ